MTTPRRNLCAVLLAIGIAAVGAWWFADPRPEKLLQQALAAGRRDSAAGERLLRRAIRSSGGHYPDAELALCLMLADQGSWEAALAQFPAIDCRACRTDLLLDFGRAALAGGYHQAGFAALESIRGRNVRDHAAALELLIQADRTWGQTDRLIAAAREWCEIEPDNPSPWIALVQALKNEERRDAECLEAVRQALSRDLPDDVRRELQHRLVEQLIVCGDAAGTRKQLERLRRSEGETFRVRLLQIDLYRLEGKPDKALEVMERVFSEARDPAEACFNRGVIYHDLGRYADAARDLERTVAAQPMNSSAQFKLSEAYRALGENDLARKHRQTADRINDTQARIAALQKQIRWSSDEAEIHLQLAKLYRELGANEMAQLWERRAAVSAGASHDGRRPAPP